MSENGIERVVENGYGRMEAGLGDAIGDPEMEAKGVGHQVRAKAGKVLDKAEDLARSTLGEGAAQKLREKGEAAADTVQGALDTAATAVEDAVTRDPYKALAIALGIGLGIGLMFGRRSHTIIYRPLRD